MDGGDGMTGGVVVSGGSKMTEVAGNPRREVC